MMTNLTQNLETKTATELRELAKEHNMTGAWKARKDEMITFLTEIHRNKLIELAQEANLEVNDDMTVEELSTILQEAKTKSEDQKPKRKGGRTRTIEVYKDGELIETIEGLMNTFKWVTENEITNVGWVKRSLKTGEETAAGYKYKIGGYLFKYAE